MILTSYSPVTEVRFVDWWNTTEVREGLKDKNTRIRWFIELAERRPEWLPEWEQHQGWGPEERDWLIRALATTSVDGVRERGMQIWMAQGLLQTLTTHEKERLRETWCKRASGDWLAETLPHYAEVLNLRGDESLRKALAERTGELEDPWRLARMRTLGVQLEVWSEEAEKQWRMRTQLSTSALLRATKTSEAATNTWATDKLREKVAEALRAHDLKEPRDKEAFVRCTETASATTQLFEGALTYPSAYTGPKEQRLRVLSQS
jgi:hypothetical protein